MPFDPTFPQAHTKANADAMRAQLNALNDLITGLTARVAALEPPVLTATGFGDAASNGALTPAGTTPVGGPIFTTPGGRYFWRQGFAAPYNWNVTEFDPNSGPAMQFLYTGTHDEVTGSYDVGTGTAPAGIVS